MMRLVCLFSLCVLLFLGPSSFSEISVEEFEKIRTIVKEEVSASEGRLRAEIAASEKRAMEHTSQEIAKLTVRMDATDKHRAAQFEAVDNRFDDTNHRFWGCEYAVESQFHFVGCVDWCCYRVAAVPGPEEGARARRETGGTTKAAGGTTAANRSTRT